MSIARIGHIAFTVTDLGRSARFAQEIIGLREIERTDEVAYLTSTTRHHQLRLRAGAHHACDEIGFDVDSSDGWRALRGRVADAGFDVTEDDDLLFDHVFHFTIDDGPTLAICSGAAAIEPVRYTAPGARPRKLGHVTLASPATEGLGTVLTDVLGFRLSDRLPLGEHADGDLTWYRCNTDHHALGLAPGAAGVHHYAFELDGFAALGTMGDHLLANGKHYIWGPGRHGPGENLFAYFEDADGSMIEFYSDMLQIEDETTYRLSSWPDVASSANVWGPAPPDVWFCYATPFGANIAAATRARG
jgi:catechol 2,3-dioxygenase